MFHRSLRCLAVAMLSLVGVSGRTAGQCPSWSSEFGVPGLNGGVVAQIVFDDGSGPRLFIGGDFTEAGGVPALNVASWDGEEFAEVGGGANAKVVDFAIYDDGGGNGPELYACGSFSHAGTSQVNYVARLEAGDWKPMGIGLQGFATSMAVFDDGTGPALFVGGDFIEAGGQTAYRFAKWNGAGWSAVGAGANSTIAAMQVFDDGTGPALYLGGSFTFIGGIQVKNLARWDGTTWSSMSSGTDDYVWALEVFDDGTGPHLYVGGRFKKAGSVNAWRIARWDGQDFSPLGLGIDGGAGSGTIGVRSLAVFDDGAGSAALYVGGNFDTAGGARAPNAARWDGYAWSPMGGGTNGSVGSFAIFDAGSGEDLYVGGGFTHAGELSRRGIARWDGSEWSGLGEGNGLDATIHALAAHDDGGGLQLYAAGLVTGGASLQAASYIARWDGSDWSTPGAGFDKAVHCLAVHDDGSGTRLFAGGDFLSAGNQPASRIAAWDGSSWSPLGSGADGIVTALSSFDADGAGPSPANLFLGGAFSAAGGVLARNIARWDGGAFHPLGQGIDGHVDVLSVHDDGNGPALYAGGAFTLAGVLPTKNIARWNGTSFQKLGAGIDGEVQALASFDDGTGVQLYAGGTFTSASGMATNHVACWNGAAWSAVGAGLDGPVRALAAFDDGSGAGPALYAAGEFSTSGGVYALHIARWDGSTWSEVSSGTDGTILALAVFDPGPMHPASLYAAGSFLKAGGLDSWRIARWRGCEPYTYCTAKVTSNGCSPSISATGRASASSSSGFVVAATSLLNNKPGLLVYGTAGKASLPFQGGTLCVASPVKRTLPQSSGGNPGPDDCSGSFSIDMNAFASGALGGSPAPELIVPGTEIACQWWGRDPGYPPPDNSMLSDALSYVVTP